jgi:hypothetical protein
METFWVVVAYTVFLGLPAFALFLLIHLSHKAGQRP